MASKRRLLTGAGLITVAGWLCAQNVTAQSTEGGASNAPGFEVASVKLNTSGDWRKSIGPAPGGRFLATNNTLKDLIPFAYGLPQATAGIRIVGGPGRIDSDRFDVVAKTDGAPSPQEIGAMPRTLLKDRFKLSAHTEARDLPVYALVVARASWIVRRNQRKTELNRL